MKHNIETVSLPPAVQKAQRLHTQAVKLLQAGQTNQGIDLLKEAFGLSPDSLPIVNNLGKALLSQDNPEEAGQYFKKILNKKPDHLDANTNLAQVYFKLRHYDKAEESYNAALNCNENHIPALMGLGVTMNQTTRTDEAIDFFNKVLDLKPEHIGAALKIIALLEFKGELTDALGKIKDARSHQKQNNNMLDLIEARILQRQKKYEAAEAILNKLKQGADNEPHMPSVYFQLGKIYDATKREYEAFESFTKANELTAKSFAAQKIDKATIPVRIEKISATFTKKFIKSWDKEPSTDTPAPVFLIGFPRSGTTLLDQILSSHPSITVAEEKQALAGVRHELGDNYPENMAALTPEKTKELQTLYFKIHDHKQNADIFVDKMPLNILDTGLAHRIFPQAKFILAQRHPFDCVLSCFMQEFTLNLSMIHFLSLKDAASLYDRTFSLWEQYCDLLPLQTHSIRYEDVVRDFKPAVNDMLKFLSQPWDDAVLAYDKTAKQKSAINTPSYHQVTEKIYDSARYRWLRYKNHLTPVFDTLAPWAEKYEY